MPIDSEIQNIAIHKEQQISESIDAFSIAIVATAAVLYSNSSSLSEVQAAVDADIAQLITRTNLQIDGLAEVVAITRKKAGNPKLSPENIQAASDFIKSSKAEFTAFFQQKGAELSNAIYSTIISGGTKEDLLATLEQLTIKQGIDNKSFRSIKNLFATKLFELDSLMLKILANDLGTTKWRYEGPTDSKNRAWCAQHVGQILDAKQIEAWRLSEWTGKKPGDPFIVRGGYNCRHHWIPVKLK